jgi:hypothetical protein
VSPFYVILRKNSAFIYIAREKPHKHSNEELLSQKFHKQNGKKCKEKKNSKRKTWILIIKTLIMGLIV